jgi:hypothetical protein
MLVPLLALAMMQNQQTVSICDVVKRPSDYRKHLIAVRAEILLALPHGAVLLDKDCPNAAIRLGVDLPEAESSVTDLLSSILNDCSEPKTDRVPGTFRGKLTFESDGRLYLHLKAVDELQIHPCWKP